MDYCTSHFGKRLNDLTIQDIEVYFLQERIETDQLEFKSISQHGNLNDKIAGIQRSICAFLNSSGGLLIWGAPEGKKVPDKKEKFYIGDLTYNLEAIEKDFLISKISDTIIPLPANIRVLILNVDANNICIIEIDPSEYSPHQISNTYYMRIDGQTKPAPHHYIEALFKKIKFPNLEAYLKINKAEIFHQASGRSEYHVSFTVFFFNWTPLQNEEQLSFRILVTDGIFNNSRVPTLGRYTLEGHEFYQENIKKVFHYGEPVYESDVIAFDPHKVERNQNKAKIIVSFGGRFSPRKNSEYTLDFTKINAANPNDMICEKKENRLSKDVQDEKGMNKELIITNLFKQ